MQDPIYDRIRKNGGDPGDDLPILPKKKPAAASDTTGISDLPILKKKEGTVSEAGGVGTSPLESPSTSILTGGTPESFIDSDVDDSFAPLGGVDINKYLPNPVNLRHPDADKVKSKIKQDNPSLAEYNKARIEALNEKKKALEFKRNAYVSYKEGDQEGRVERVIKDKKAYDDAQKEVDQIDEYIGKLRNNVAEIAATNAVANKDISQLQPRLVGREIAAASNPHLEEQFKRIEKGGNFIPNIKQTELERAGLNAMRKHAQTLTDPAEKQQLESLVASYESDFDDRNFDATAQRVREKVAAAWYKEGNSGFWGNSEKDLIGKINDPATGLTPSEKRIGMSYVVPLERGNIGTDIPGSGFKRSFVNAIAQSINNTNNTLASAVGVRNDSDRATELLNDEVGGSKFRPPGENPNLLGELEYLRNKEKTAGLNEQEKKYKVEIEKYTDIRSNGARMLDGMGNLTGQVAWMAFGTKGLGAVGKGLSAFSKAGGVLGGMTSGVAGNVLQSSAGGLAISSYLNAYDNYRKSALLIMPGEDQEGERQAYATIMAGMEAASERIFPDTKILTAFTRGMSPSVKDIAQRFVNKEITQQVAKAELSNATQTYLKQFGKEYASSTVQESTEEGVVDLADGVASAVFGGTDFDVVKTGKQAVNTFLTTALHSPIVSGLAAHGAARRSKTENSFMRSALFDMGQQPQQYLSAVTDLLANENITQDQYNEKVKLINSANAAVNELPENKTLKIGDIEIEKPFDVAEKTSYIVHRMNEGVLSEEIERLKKSPTPDNVRIQKLEKEAKRSEAIRKGIYEGNIGVTPDVQEVTDDDTKAADLGILSTKQALPGDLIGTPFKKAQDEKQPDQAMPDVTAKTVPPEGEHSAQTQVEAADFVNELIKEKLIPDTFHQTAKRNPLGFFKMVADQAQNVTEGGQVNQTDSPEAATREQFTDSVVDYAIELFPAPAAAKPAAAPPAVVEPAEEEAGPLDEKGLQTVADTMVKMENTFNNRGYTLIDDFDGEVNVIDKKTGKIVDPENVPADLLPMVQQYEQALGKLSETTDPMPLLAQSRKNFQGEEAEFEEVAPAKLPAPSAVFSQKGMAAVEDYLGENKGGYAIVARQGKEGGSVGLARRGDDMEGSFVEYTKDEFKEIRTLDKELEGGLITRQEHFAATKELNKKVLARGLKQKVAPAPPAKQPAAPPKQPPAPPAAPAAQPPVTPQTAEEKEQQVADIERRRKEDLDADKFIKPLKDAWPSLFAHISSQSQIEDAVRWVAENAPNPEQRTLAEKWLGATKYPHFINEKYDAEIAARNKEISQPKTKTDATADSYVEENAVTSGLTGGFRASSQAGFRQETENKSENRGLAADPRNFKNTDKYEYELVWGNETEGTPYLFKLTDKKTDKKYLFFAVNNPTETADRSRDGYFQMSVRDNGKLPSDIESVLMQKGIDEYDNIQKRYPDIYKPNISKPKTKTDANQEKGGKKSTEEEVTTQAKPGTTQAAATTEPPGTGVAAAAKPPESGITPTTQPSESGVAPATTTTGAGITPAPTTTGTGVAPTTEPSESGIAPTTTTPGAIGAGGGITGGGIGIQPINPSDKGDTGTEGGQRGGGIGYIAKPDRGGGTGEGGIIPGSQRLIRDEKLKKEIDDAWDDFLSGSDILTSGGLDPKKIEQGTKLVGLYIKAGFRKFADIIKDAYLKFGDKIRNLFDALKSVYSSYYATQATDEEAADMDANIRNFDIEKVIAEVEKSLSPTEEHNLPENPTRVFVDTVKNYLREGRKLNIIALRNIAKSQELEASDTDLQEMTELAIVELAREISLSTASSEDRYAQLVELYNTQPTISMRSSQRISEQQYSTPIPMAFVMGEFASTKNPALVYEPNAGTGMLTIAIPPNRVIANETDPKRLEMLGEQGFNTITANDARKPLPLKVDAVIMNPPFGKSEAKDFDGYKISGLDEQMIATALRALTPKGKAAIIMGGHNSYDEIGRLKADRVFFNYLYSHYNVADVINVDGSLYAKQGTTFPVRIILIDGVKDFPDGYAPLEDKDANIPIDNFDKLYERVHNTIQNGYKDQQDGIQPGVDEYPNNGNIIPDRDTTGIQEDNAERGRSGTNSTQDQLLDTTEHSNGGEATRDDTGLIGNLPGDSGTGLRQPSRPDTTNEPLETGLGGVQGEQEQTGTQPEGSRGNIFGDKPVSVSGGTVELLDEKSPYKPKSKSGPLDTVIPNQMATETYHVLDAIESLYGDIDNFVMRELGYPDLPAMFEALGAEQVDGLALAIHQMKNGQGMIIGDQTGIGKGRQAAGVIRYAVRQGKKPIFITEKVNLFSDLHRDLVNIGSGDLVPFIMNTKSTNNNPDITDEDNNVVHKALPAAATKHIFNGDEIPSGYDFMVTTYSQLRKIGPSPKRDFFLRTVQDNFLIMDESHNASGDSNSGRLFQGALSTTAGVVFLSATYAKRPNNMPVYATKTAMQDANMTMEELVAAIERGGVALQEVVSAQLVSSGQMVRRERSMDGVKIKYTVLDDFKEEHRKTADSFTEQVRDIIQFEKHYVLPALADIDEGLAGEGAGAGQAGSQREVGITNTPFASKTFNLINQMLFAIKAKEIARQAIKVFKEDNVKPVIGFLSTMESFLDAMNAQVGERIEKADFALVLKRALEGTLRYTEHTANGDKIVRYIPLSDLSPEGQTRYRTILDNIRKVSSGVHVSPIDVMTKILEDAGLKVGEITGRDLKLEIQPDGSSIVKKRKKEGINAITRSFNGGKLEKGEEPTNTSETDVILLNASGATGISLHASRTFKDQRERVLLSGQLELDINKEVQKRGRIDRTNQAERGSFDYIISAIPAEQRLLIMFKAKLASLDANTTSSQTSKLSEIKATDFLNKYGDEIVVSYLKENSEFNDRINDPLKLNDKSEDELAEFRTKEGAASRVSGAVAILPTKEQEVFYNDIIQAFETQIQYLNDNNANDLKVQLVPLRAKIISTVEVIEGRGTNSPFGMPSVRETVEVDILTKPMKKEEIDEQVEKGLNGKTTAEFRRDMLTGLSAYEETFIDKKIFFIENNYDENIIPEAKARGEKKGKTPQEINEIVDALEEVKDRKVERERLKYQNIFSNVEGVMRTFIPGEVYSIPATARVDTNTTYSKAIFLGYQIKEGSANKFTPSNIILRFAANDSRRLVTVPVSKADYVNAIIANSRFIGNKEEIKENWDKRISNKTRGTRYIVTGNLLQAYGTNDGQLISFTMENGAIRKGLLLPDSYDPSKQKFRSTISRAFGDGDTRIESTDGDVVVIRESYNSFSITVPLSRAKGGKYFLDDTLRELARGGGFNQRSGRMVAIYNEEQIRDALLRLDALGVTTEVDAKGRERDSRDDKRDKLGDDFDNDVDSPLPSLARLAAPAGQISEEIKKYEDPKVVLDEARKHFKDIPAIGRILDMMEPILAANKHIRINPSIKLNTLTEQETGSHKGSDLDGLAFPDGSIAINFNRLQDKADMLRVMIHELIHGVTRNEIKGNQAFRDELQDVLSTLRAHMKVPDNTTFAQAIINAGILYKNEDDPAEQKRIQEEWLGKYGLANEFEMLAEVFTNKNFYDLVKSIPYKKDNLLKRFFFKVASVFSDKYKAVSAAKSTSAENMADYLLELTDNVLKRKKVKFTGRLDISRPSPARDNRVAAWINRKIQEGYTHDDIKSVLMKKMNISMQEASDLVNENVVKEKAAKIPPSVNKYDPDQSEGEARLTEMAKDIPNDGSMREYESKGTIEKYNPGQELTNSQTVTEQQLNPALYHGENMIAVAKDTYGEENYVESTLDYIENTNIPVRAKSLLYISLENDLARQRQYDPVSLDLQKKQALVRAASQAFLRESSISINFGKLRKIGLVGYDISAVTDNFFSPGELSDKHTIERIIEANADKINQQEEETTYGESEVQQIVTEAVETEVAKIYEKLPTQRKKVADRAINALENFQKKIRGRAYDATIGVPLAIIDGGISAIKRAIKTGVAIADAIELGIQYIKDHYGKPWPNEDLFRADVTAAFTDAETQRLAHLVPKNVVKEALIEAGFGRTVKTTKKDGTQGTKQLIDWKALAGSEGSIDRMKANVEKVFLDRGLAKDEIDAIQIDLEDQYNELRAKIIEKSIAALNRKNKKAVTPTQTSAARKLAELYNYGLFEKNPADFDIALAKAIGMDKLSPARFERAHELGRALEIMYSEKFNGKKLNDIELKTAIQSVEEKMRLLLHEEAQGHGSTALKIADTVRTYMDAVQRMILNNLKQAVENPLSAFQQTLISNISRLLSPTSTPEMRKQKRQLANAVYKDMILAGGVNYGDVSTQFVSRGNLDAYINKLSDNQLVHAILSIGMGKATLDGLDSYYKAKLTDQQFTHNLIKILTQPRLVNGQEVEAMSKEDAINFVSERLTGQTFEDAMITAQGIVTRVNASAKSKIVNDSPDFVIRLANDIVKAALVNGSTITADQVTAAYNAAYAAAGRNLGHVANNIISEQVQNAAGKIEKQINDAIKNKEYKRAALLTYKSIMFRNVFNPFIAGGTNWIVIKLEKVGLGLISGAYLYHVKGAKPDLTTERGMKNLENALYEEAIARDSMMRGAIGGVVTAAMTFLWLGINDDDEYRKWRNRNMWAARYLDLITPETVLATMAAKNKELLYYGKTLFNRNDQYSKAGKLISGTVKVITETGKKRERGWALIGESIGGSMGVPIPWRLVRDGQNLWLGATGETPYKVSSEPAHGLTEGYLKAGMVDYIINNPARGIPQETSDKEEPESATSTRRR